MISLKKQSKGFTVIELVIVIIVIGIMGLLVVKAYQGIHQRQRNDKREVAIQAIQKELETFFSQNGYYPSRADLNSNIWLNANLKDFDRKKFADPSNAKKSQKLETAPAAKVYAYEVTDSSNNSCEATDTTCAKYILTATYEGTVNGATTYVKTNQE